MQILRFQHAGQNHYGRLIGNTIHVSSQHHLLETPEDTGQTVPLTDVQAMAPLLPGKIVCIGLNYGDHAREQGKTPPEKPLIFAKFNTAVIGHGDVISWSEDLTHQVDFEGELAVIIGQTARRVSKEDALKLVFGYTTANDITARDLQYGDGQWVRGKSLDTFCPLGPIVTTADDIPNPQDLRITTQLNGETMQDGSTQDMIFGVAHLISYCSHAFTLQPGDVILTGTPDGVGMHRKPPRFLTNGDTISVEIAGIGRLENTCQTIKS